MQMIQPKPAQAVVFAFCLMSAPTVPAQTPPGNDTCPGAIEVPDTVSPTTPYVSGKIEVSGATTTGDPPLPIDCGTNVSRSIWFRFAPPTTALYTLSVSADTSTTVEDTVMAIYTSPSACSGPFTLFACNDDSGLLRSAISTNFTAHTTYYVVVWVGAVTDVSEKPLNVQLRVSRPVAPTNDLCSGAEIIPTSAALPYLTALTDTTRASETNDPPSTCLDFTGVRSIWYRFTPAETGTYIFSTASDTATTVDDTALTIYQSAGDCAGAFTELSCGDNGFGRAVVSTPLSAGQNYYVVVRDQTFESRPGQPSEYIAGETLVQLRVLQTAAPTVATLGAGNTTSTSALLTASINPNGALSRYWFEWGTDTSYGNTSAVRLLLFGTTTITNSIAISGYPTNGPIHFRAVAANSVGRSDGLNRAFFWSRTPPRLVGATNLGGGDYRFTFTGNPAQLYLVQMSTNLTSWIDIGAAPEIRPSQYEFIQNGAATLPQRFFRVKIP